MPHRPVFVPSKATGGHYALQTDRSDHPFENPLSSYAKLHLLPTDVVADIGAYVGEYALFALEQGVRRVYAYEPTPYTFSILTMNKKPGMELHNLAVVGTDAPFVYLYLSKGIGVTNSVVKSLHKVGAVQVPAIRYERALRDATVVKIDVEGAEYGFKIVQPQLRAIVLEFHPLVGKPWLRWAEAIMASIERAGFTCVERPSFRSGWSLTGCWQRPLTRLGKRSADRRLEDDPSIAAERS